MGPVVSTTAKNANQPDEEAAVSEKQQSSSRSVIADKKSNQLAAANTIPDFSLHLRLPAPPPDLARSSFIRESTPLAGIDPVENAAALQSFGIDSTAFTEGLKVRDTYGRHWKSFVEMARGIFPKAPIEADSELTLAIETLLNEDALSEHPAEKLSPTTREAIAHLQQLELQFEQFLDAWYNSSESSVRLQLIAELQKRQPEFRLEFADAHDLASASKVLGGEVSQYKICNTIPKTLEELFTNFIGLGGFTSNGDTTYQHLIAVGAVTPEQVAASGSDELAAITKQLPELSKNASLGQTLIHEEIHARTGYPHQNTGSFSFSTAEQAMEIPSVLFELLTITDNYHQWMKSKDPDYDYRTQPTGIILKTPQAELSVDFIYREAKERFGVLDHDGVDAFLALLDKPESVAFLNRLIWGSGRAPELAIPGAERGSRLLP